MSRKARWLDDPVFQTLCDLVASDRLVCVTGAGISSGLPHASKPGEKLPGWGKLLATLYRDLKDSLGGEEKRDVRRLLGRKSTNEELIEAATLLRAGREDRFDARLRDAVTHRRKSTGQVHRALLDIQPRGILTFNYDLAHENAIEEKGQTPEWDFLLPWEERRLHRVLRGSDHRPFLLKAHGCLSSDRQLVLTYESYRDLLVKFPVYRAFVRNVLVNYSLLIVGFGLSDPDFDQFIESLSFQLGAPLRPHVVIRHRDQKAGETLLRRRYCIHTLYVDDYDEIPRVIRQSVRKTGPELQKTLDKCISPEIAARVEGHRELGRLGRAGKVRASHVLRAEIKKSGGGVTRLSEIAYSLGKIEPMEGETKKALFDIAEQSTHVEPAAHALLALRDALVIEDTPRLEEMLKRLRRRRLKSTPDEPDPDNRLPVYLQFLIFYVRAKYLDKAPAKTGRRP